MSVVPVSCHVHWNDMTAFHNPAWTECRGSTVLRCDAINVISPAVESFLYDPLLAQGKAIALSWLLARLTVA